MSDSVVPLRPAADVTEAAGAALTAVHRHLDRCKLSANTVKAYKRQATAYVAWPTEIGTTMTIPLIRSTSGHQTTRPSGCTGPG